MSKFLRTLLILIASILFLISAFTKNMLFALGALLLSLMLEVIRRKKDTESNKGQPKVFLEDIKKERKN